MWSFGAQRATSVVKMRVLSHRCAFSTNAANNTLLEWGYTVMTTADPEQKVSLTRQGVEAWRTSEGKMPIGIG